MVHAQGNQLHQLTSSMAPADLRRRSPGATEAELRRALAERVRRGERFGLGDRLIGALAKETGALVWSLDKDFERMEALGLVGRYQP